MKKVSRTHSSRKTAAKSAKQKKRGASLRQKQAKADPATTGYEKQVAANAKRVFKRAHNLEQKAHALHGAIDKVHQTAHELHSPGTTPVPLSRPGAVVEEEPQRPGSAFPIVGIGASAGGYEAFADFTRALPKNTGMAFVLVQHLDPHHKSQLTELLRNNSKIPVLRVHNEETVEPDRIYVIPENSQLTIRDGNLRLTPRNKKSSPPMPIDTFFRSLAKYQKSRTIGIVLSGTGSDGTLGIEAIKGEGGITFAQDDGSAKYYGMPGSAIASGAVDFVMPPSEIARELGRIAQHPFLGPRRRTGHKAPEQPELEPQMPESGNDLAILFRLMRARTGVDFSQYKQSTLKRRIGRRMILHKKRTLRQYLSLLEKSTAEVDALYNDLLINVTNFFRDAKTFQALKKKILPRLLKTRDSDSTLRFWVCGCSTGEEAYSLAMLLVEFFEQFRVHRPVQIFATDISEAAIEKARAGIYPPNIQQDVSPERLRRFFSKVNGHYQVHKAVRDMCVFARQNVLVDPPFSNIDLVSCRNVLIYLGPELQRKVIPVFHYALRAHGMLLLGNSETIGAATEHFGLLDKKHKIYLKRGGTVRPAFEVHGRILPPGEARIQGHPAPEQKPLDLQQQVDNLMVRDFLPAGVVVNSQFDIVLFRGRTGMFLEHAPGGASLNLFRMLRETLSVSVRAALGKAQRHNAPVKQSGIEFLFEGRKYELTIEVVPLRLDGLQERHFLVVLRENPSGGDSVTAARRSGKTTPSPGEERLTRDLERVKKELAVYKESMQAFVEEQEGTNEELKSANEEIQSSNEELQSTNEELETAKEELQSTNEELTTLNEELQNRNVELSCANNDLQNLLASVNLPILMVGSDLAIRRFTPMAERFFNLIPSDVDRRLTDMSRAILVPDLAQTVRKVIDELTIVDREIQGPDGQWFMLRIRPYRTRENQIEGAVIVVIDIDQLRRSLNMVMGMVRQPLLMLGEDLKVRNANQAFLELFELNLQETLNRFVYDLGSGQWDIPHLRRLLGEVLPRNQQVTDYELDANFPKIGFRKLRLNASRFFAEGQGLPLILLAVDDVTTHGKLSGLESQES